MSFLKNVKTAKMAAIASLLFMTSILATDAMTGAGGTKFANIYTLLLGWSQNSMGKFIAVPMFLAGIPVGIYKQSLTTVLICVGGTLYYLWLLMNQCQSL